MNIKRYLGLITLLVLTIIFISIILITGNKNNDSYKELTATVLSVSESDIIILDQNNNIYTLSSFGYDIKSGDLLVIKYAGLLDDSKSVQSIDVVDYKVVEDTKDENGIPSSWKDNGIFSDYYVMAFNKLKTLSLEEKIGQLLLVRYSDNAISAINDYKVSGFVFFEKDFKDKTKTEVKNMIENLQDVSKIPLLTAVDEEGGSVVRVSSNSNLADEPFKSSKELYDEGGLDLIKEDTKKKSKVLSDLGLNVNLAPVVDVSTDPNDYMYDRTIGQNTSITSKYAKTVIEASKGTNVSYVLKHFPGYGNNSDTHTGSSTDNRTLNDILTNDIPPFEAGIDVGAEAVLVSHNIIASLDADNPASLSPVVHNLLRNNLNFTGVIITDDISMGALDSIDNVATKALLAGNDLIITSDYETSFNQIKTAIDNGDIDEDIINKLALRVLAWKYYKGLMNLK